MALNDEQIRAIQAPSPTLVNASAGSGKTRCLIAKIESILKAGAPPASICAITFTNKAANEMKSRLKGFNIKDMQISTIHSMCVRIIRSFYKHTYLRPPFSIYDDNDQLSVIKTILKARDITTQPNEVLSAISRAKSEDRTDDLDEKSVDEVHSATLGDIYKAYQEILKKNNACDFDDLQLLAIKCLEHKDCRDYFTGLWKHILVDEFQDTSIIQFKIIQLLYNQSTRTLFIVGDANQSIYRWRSAHPENMTDFQRKYNPTVCYLTYNYRSCPDIIKQANGFLQYGKPMVAKSSNKGNISMSAWDSLEDEANKIATGISLMDKHEETAILYRVNSRSLFFEQTLARMGIPYQVIGDKPFFQRRVVRDMLAYLKASANPSDLESTVRIVNTPKRGFGEAKQEKLYLEGRTYLEYMALEMPAIESFLKLLQDIKGMTPYRAISEVLERTGYRQALTKDSDINMLTALLETVQTYKSVEELILASTFLERDTGNGVKLMTAHASKGLEFDRVFVVGVEFDTWPHKFSTDLDEESRLFYVACTRARRYLNISYSRSKTYRGTRIDLYPSVLFKRAYQNLYGKPMKG